VPVTARVDQQLDSVVAYLDPALTRDLERTALQPDRPTTDPTQLRQQLGSERLIVIGCHGHAASGLTAVLTASDGTAVAIAADLLTPATWAARSLRARAGAIALIP
jgi:hypothetical protein